MIGYVATVNVPGYLPMDDDPPIFSTAREAWEYLRDDWDRCAEDHDSDGPNAEEEDLAGHFYGPSGPDSEGLIYTATPGYEGDHDLGLAYSVTAVTVQECSSCGVLVQDDDSEPDQRFLCAECVR